jgi:hypothetical protein
LRPNGRSLAAALAEDQEDVEVQSTSVSLSPAISSRWAPVFDGRAGRHEGLKVGTGGGLDRGAADAQKGVGLPQTDQVGSDYALGAVLGAQVPLERADEGASGGLVHDPKR